MLQKAWCKEKLSVLFVKYVVTLIFLHLHVFFRTLKTS